MPRVSAGAVAGSVLAVASISRVPARTTGLSCQIIGSRGLCSRVIPVVSTRNCLCQGVLNRTVRSAAFPSQRTWNISSTRRRLATHATAAEPEHYEAVVVGAGPAGVTCVGNLLERKLSPILWVDDSFNGGRVNRLYREVPSNTKVKLFIDFATAVTPFRRIVAGAPLQSRWEDEADLEEKGKEDQLRSLRALEQDKGCRLSHAADMVLMLTEGLKRTAGITAQTARVAEAVLDEGKSEWNVRLDSQEGGSSINAKTKRLVLCTGASPRNDPLPVSIPDIQLLDLDTALSPSRLQKAMPSTGPTTVAVIGASHSAILVLMNLYTLAAQGKADLRIKWFTRHPLRYAEYMDGWILRDNTGLKGEAAAWAKANLEPETLPHSEVNQYLTKVAYDAGAETDTFAEHMPGCDYFVQAIGYDRDALPALRSSRGREITPVFDHETGAFTYGSKDQQARLPGLYGAGIAFPERVKDPLGNVEMAVGFFKFMKFVKKVSPEWN